MDSSAQFPGVVYQLRSGFSSRRVGDKVFILAADGAMHILENSAAVALWDQILARDKGPFVSEDLGATLTSSFDVDPETAAADSREFLEKLCVLGILGRDP